MEEAGRIVASDQVPIWIARQGRRTVFAGHEKGKNSKQSMQATGGKRDIMRISDMQWSQKLPEKVNELADQAATQGMSQCRSGAGCDGEDDKFRITLELRHAVLRFFEGPLAPPEHIMNFSRTLCSMELMQDVRTSRRTGYGWRTRTYG